MTGVSIGSASGQGTWLLCARLVIYLHVCVCVCVCACVRDSGGMCSSVSRDMDRTRRTVDGVAALSTRFDFQPLHAYLCDGQSGFWWGNPEGKRSLGRL